MCALLYEGNLKEAQNITNSLWSVVALGLLLKHSVASQQLLDHVCKVGPDALSPESLAQLWQVHVEAQHLHLPQLQLHGPMLDAVRDSVLEQQLETQRLQLLQPSSFEVVVIEYLRQLQSQHPAVDVPGSTGISEVRVEQLLSVTRSGTSVCSPPNPPCPGGETLVLVDFVVVMSVGGQLVPVAVEVDGPTHFQANSPHRQECDGRTLLRNRWLRHAFGERLVTVPCWEWNELRDEQRPNYLWHLLVSAAVSGNTSQVCAEASACTLSKKLPPPCEPTACTLAACSHEQSQWLMFHEPL
jgi:hypothetical protein